MAEAVCALGIDPGLTTGIALLRWDDRELTGRHVIQCDHAIAAALIRALLEEPHQGNVVAGIEAWVAGPRSTRLRGSEGVITQQLIGALTGMITRWPVRLSKRAAGAVKPWATDVRIAAAGLTGITKGMPHARDACRHALYAACADADIPDPLSQKAVAQ